MRWCQPHSGTAEGSARASVGVLPRRFAVGPGTAPAQGPAV